MGNVIDFPASPLTSGSHVSAALLADPAPHTHVVQFYESEEFLYDTVARFLAPGLQNGDRVVVIAGSVHRGALTRRLEHLGTERALRSGQLVLLDARETLAKFMVEGMPDASRFREVIAGVVASTLSAHPGTRLRAYGEMVDLLWREGNSRAAFRLEELWNEAGQAHSFSLLCAYVMGNFYKQGDAAKFMEICRTHSHVIPTEEFAQVDDADARLREISLLQQRAKSLESEIRQRQELEAALRDALGERNRVEEALRAAVKRETAARERAEASDAFKEMFLGVLGHDLRNPLNTILTTTRLMARRGELGQESEKRLQRVISSGERMGTMIEQLLDLARARLSDGIPVNRVADQDLGALAARIVEEAHGAAPSRHIDLIVSGPCPAPLDADRVEQVISNLIGNAIMHGDAKRPVTVEVKLAADVASVSVHNFGAPIAPAFRATLFDPFKRGDSARGRRDGLGLVLYIAERIVHAHSGRIEVHSSLESGTRFEALFPLTPP